MPGVHAEIMPTGCRAVVLGTASAASEPRRAAAGLAGQRRVARDGDAARNLCRAYRRHGTRIGRRQRRRACPLLAMGAAAPTHAPRSQCSDPRSSRAAAW